MTALTQYERLEAIGLWRSAPDQQRREVTISIGDATLVLTDSAERALGHWSLPSIHRVNPGERPAIFAPDIDDSETLEIDDQDMIAALSKVQKAMGGGLRPTRLRYVVSAAIIGLFCVVGALWLPGAIRSNARSILPESKHIEFGAKTVGALRPYFGAPCRDPIALPALQRFTNRMKTGTRNLQLLVVPQSLDHVVALPGNIYLLGRNIVEDYEDPNVAAGFIVEAIIQANATDPLNELLKSAGTLSTLSLLSSGELPAESFENYAQSVATQQVEILHADLLMPGFEAAQLGAKPYAYAQVDEGKDMLDLIELAELAEYAQTAVLSDRDWIALQGICSIDG